MNNLLITNNYQNICNYKKLNKTRQKYFFAAFFTLLFGLIIYAFFRNHDFVIYQFIPKPSYINMFNFTLKTDTLFTSMFLFNLPDGLWFLSGLLMIRAVWLTNPLWHLVYFLIFSIIAVFMETLQIFSFLPGTFDFLDILFMVFFAFFENLFFILLIKRKVYQ